MASLPQRLADVPAGRESLSREVIAGHQRQHIVAAAIPVFAKRGYQGVRIHHIVSAAKIGVGKFYELFENKEQCFLACYEQIVGQAREQISAALPADQPWAEQVLVGLKALLALIAERPFAARLALAEVQTAGAEALARHADLSSEAAAFMRQGRVRGSLAAQLPDTFDDAIVGGLAWLLQQRVVMGEAGDATALLPEVVELALEPYVGEQEASRLLDAAGSAA